MTGRKGRVVSTDEGNVVYESRSEIDAPLETLNLTEKQRFMDGEKVSTSARGTSRTFFIRSTPKLVVSTFSIRGPFPQRFLRTIQHYVCVAVIL